MKWIENNGNKYPAKYIDVMCMEHSIFNKSSLCDAQEAYIIRIMHRVNDQWIRTDTNRPYGNSEDGQIITHWAYIPKPYSYKWLI